MASLISASICRVIDQLPDYIISPDAQDISESVCLRKEQFRKNISIIHAREDRGQAPSCQIGIEQDCSMRNGTNNSFTQNSSVSRMFRLLKT